MASPPPCPFALSPSAGNSLGVWTLKVWVVLFRFPTPEKNYLTVIQLISRAVSYFVLHGQAGEKTEKAGNEVDCHNIKHPAI